jgi:glutathione S-transferase
VLKIYHVKGTRSLRPIWLCYELSLPFEIVPIDFSPAFRNSPDWRAISPAGKVPAMTDEDMTMFESGAMVDYILERYGNGRLRPPLGTAQSALHHQWCWFSEATLIRPLGINRLVRHTGDTHDPVAAEGVQKTRSCIEVVDQAVSDRDYLLGEEFGASDIMMGYSLELLASLKVLDGQYPRALAYLERLRTREGFRRAMES